LRGDNQGTRTDPQCPERRNRRHRTTVQSEETRRSRLESRLDVEIRSPRLLGIDALGDVEADETVHERRADSCATQRSAGMREITTASRPTQVAEYNLAE